MTAVQPRAARNKLRLPDRIKGWKPALVCALIMLAVAAVIVGARWHGRLQRVELFVYDRFIPLIPAGDYPRPPVFIVEITEKDTRPEAMGFPASDDALAQLLTRILEGRPRAVGVDLFRDRVEPPSSGTLNAVLQQNSNVIVVDTLPDPGTGYATPAHESVRDQPLRVGFADHTKDYDGAHRRALLAAGDGYSLAWRLAQVACNSTDPNADALGEYRLTALKGSAGPYALPDDEFPGAQVLDDYAGDAAIQSFTAGNVLKPDFTSRIFHESVVIIGTATGDRHVTPIDWEMQGVRHQANVTDQVMRLSLGQKPLRYWGEIGESIYIIIWTACGGLAALAALYLRSFGKQSTLTDTTARGMRLFLVLLVFGVAVIWFTGHFGMRARFFVPVVPPLLGFASSAALITVFTYYREREARRMERALVEMHIPKVIVDRLLADPQAFLRENRLPSERVFASVLFSDLAGFSTQAEQMDPKDVETWVNDYLGEMALAVAGSGNEQARGFVKQFRGDQVMALFGPPFAHAGDEVNEDARQAVESALDMRDRLAALNSKWVAAGRMHTRMRVGICSGELVTGTVGGGGRVEYDVFGDCANTASRLESWNKERMEPEIAPGGCRILISGPTRDLVGDQFELKDLGPQPLKGKNQEVNVYAVVGRRRSSPRAASGAVAPDTDIIRRVREPEVARS